METNVISVSFSSPLLSMQLVIANGSLYPEIYLPGLSWSLTSCVTLGNSFNSSECQLPHLESGYNNEAYVLSCYKIRLSA